MARIRPVAALAALLALLSTTAGSACGGSGDAARSGTDDAATHGTDGGPRDGATGDDGGAGDDGGGGGDGGTTTRIRLVAGNLSSGTKSSWDGGEGIRLLKALHPDVAMIQEVNYGQNAASDIRAFVDAAFDAKAVYAREDTVGLPNAVVSRFPIVASGNWTDALVTNRSFVWAHIDLPGPVDLWAVSVHLLTTSSSSRGQEATQLVGYVKQNVPAGAYVVIGGDCNTDARDEAAPTSFAAVVSTGGPYPADQQGSDLTNAPRTHPYDWVMVSPDLGAHEVPLVLGSATLAHGLVFDTRVFTPIADAPPAMASDSAATGMQHMAVARDFEVPTP